MLKRADYRPIPIGGGLIFGGDDWLFWSQEHRNREITGARFVTEMHTSSLAPEFATVRMADKQWWFIASRSLIGTRSWHAWATRRNRLHDRRIAARAFVKRTFAVVERRRAKREVRRIASHSRVDS